MLDRDVNAKLLEKFRHCGRIRIRNSETLQATACRRIGGWM